MMIRKAIGILLLHYCLLAISQDNGVYYSMRLTGVKIHTYNVAEGGSNEFTFRFWTEDRWENKNEEQVIVGPEIMFSNSWLGVNEFRQESINSSTFKVCIDAYEDDCGEWYNYDDCGAERDDEFRLVEERRSFSGYESGVPHNIDFNAGIYEFRIQFIWYPAPFGSSYEVKISGNDNPPSWEDQISYSYPTMNPDNSSGIYCEPFIRTLRSPRAASVDNNALIYFEYFDNNDNVWRLFEPATTNQTITVDLGLDFYNSIKMPGELTTRLDIRIYRKTPSGVRVVDSIDTYTTTHFHMMSVDIYTHKRFYQQNDARLWKFLNPPPPTLNDDTLFGIAPVCYNESNGSIDIDPSLINGNGKDVYKISMRLCPSGCPSCFTDNVTPYCSINEATIRTDGAVAEFHNLTSNLYVMQITDLNSIDLPAEGCSSLHPVIIPVKPPIAVTAIDTVYTNTEVRCFDTQDGIATLTISGGNTPYFASPTDSNGGTWEIVTGNTHKLYNLAPGHHTFFAGDSEGCPVAFVRDTITVPDTLRLYLQEKKRFVEDIIEPGFRHVSCFHASDGEYTVHTRCDSGATKVNPNFRYWITGTNSQGASYVSDTLEGNTTGLDGRDEAEVFTNLSAGFFTIHLKDNNDCYFTDTFTLREPSPLTLDQLSLRNNLCANGKEGLLKVLSGGATHPYSYYKDAWDPYPNSTWRVCTWNNFVSGDCNVSDLHNTGKTMEDTAYYSNLPSFMHSAYVRDTNGCITTLPFTISEPPSIIPNVITKNVECKGESNGMLVATATGGVPPYEFAWDRLGAPLANNDTLEAVSAGKYSVKIEDANGCVIKTSNYDVLEANHPLTASADITKPVSCADNNDAKISVTALGGGTGYQFSLDGSTWQTQNDFEHLAAGFYTVHVKDNMGCHIVVPTLEIERPNALTAVLNNTPRVSCYNTADATISLSLSGGTPEYYYNITGAWISTGSTLQLTGIPAGNVVIEFRDQHNCQLSKTISVDAPAVLSISTTSETKASIGASDGSVTVAASGGTAPYIYSWPSHNDGPISGSSTLSNQVAGVYALTVTDAQNCTTSKPIGISNIDGPTEIISLTYIQSPRCHNTLDGSISISYDGVNPITYEWFPVANSTSLISGIPAGEYLVRVTGGNGAITTAIYTVLAPEPLGVQSSTSNLLCYNACTASIYLGVNGGTGPYAVQWNSGQMTARISNLCSGEYAYLVTDAHNCTVSGEVEILNPSPVAVNIGDDRTLCRGQFATLDAGNDGCTYLWNTGAVTKSISAPEAGEYIVTVTTPDGCQGSDTMNIEVSDNLLAAVYYNATKIYAGTTLVFVDNTLPEPDHVEWDFGDSCIVINDGNQFSPQVMFPYSGTFYVNMIAHLGDCKDTIRKVVKVFALEDSSGFQSGRYITGIEEMKVFPNPASSNVAVHLKLFEENEVSVFIIDGFGNVVNSQLLSGASQFEYTFDTSTLARGIYVLRALSGTSQKSLVLTLK